jgi:hypothetical protein
MSRTEGNPAVAGGGAGEEVKGPVALATVVTFALSACVSHRAPPPSSEEPLPSPKPTFDYALWKRKTDELLNPHPPDEKLEKQFKVAHYKVVACWQRHLQKTVRATSRDFEALAKDACRSCNEENRASAHASFLADTVKTPLSANEDKSLQSQIAYCQSAASLDAGKIGSDLELAERNKFVEIKLEDMKAAIALAIACSKPYVANFALNTSETPSDIATSSFEKCSQLWQQAAIESEQRAFLKNGTHIGISTVTDQLRESWARNTIATVVELRASRSSSTKHPN